VLVSLKWIVLTSGRQPTLLYPADAFTPTADQNLCATVPATQSGHRALPNSS